jgi:hypothetical protein
VVATVKLLRTALSGQLSGSAGRFKRPVQLSVELGGSTVRSNCAVRLNDSWAETAETVSATVTAM